MMLVRRTEALGEQPVPMLRCPPQTPQIGTQVSAIPALLDISHYTIPSFVSYGKRTRSSVPALM